jgi:translation initiation factor IF-3
MGHTQCVGHQNVFREKLNSLASPFSYLFSTDTRITDSKASESSVQKTSATCPRKRKNDSGPVITLIGTDNNPTVLTFSEAEKIAKRRDLKLIKITDLDTKTQRPIYRLMTGAQYYEEDRKVRQEKSTKKEGGFKGEKLLTLSHRITPHDVSSRLKNISKWLSKNYEVRIVINGDKENMKCAVSVRNNMCECLLHPVYCGLMFGDLGCSCVNKPWCEEVYFV